MTPKEGDLVRVRHDPHVPQELWDQAGRIVGEMHDQRLVVRFGAGEEVPLFPEYLVPLPGQVGPPNNPFDVFPGPSRLWPL